MNTRRDASIVAVSEKEDAPTHSPGLLIPVCKTEEKEPAEEVVSLVPRQSNALMLMAVAVMFMMSVGVTTYIALLGQTQGQAASPIIVLGDDSSDEPAQLSYGEKVSFSEPSFFADIKEALLLSNATFIEADLASMQLRMYKKGVEAFSTKILSKGQKGSLTETPAGMYVIEEKEMLYQSPESGAYHPWSMLFQGNFYIHGQPYFDDTVVDPAPYSSGGIRISDAAAEELFSMTALETTVLVHEEAAASDSFVYEPTVPEVTASHYLVADINNNAVLAGSDMDIQVPIASLTKLMTAMVAVEHLNVEDMITIDGSYRSSTTVPRLVEGEVISVYDLLRLMLVESSNEAADVIALQIGRSEFVDLMNEKARSLGLEHTSFADPSGLNDNNTSTLRDLLHFTQYLYNNRSFILKLTADSDLLQVISVMDGLSNFNDVDGVDSFIGGKVGETTAAGQTSITLHQIEVKGSKRVIAVVILDSEDRPGDVRQLTEYIHTRFSL